MLLFGFLDLRRIRDGIVEGDIKDAPEGIRNTLPSPSPDNRHPKAMFISCFNVNISL